MTAFRLRDARPDDRAGAYQVCLRTGRFGDDATSDYLDDPDALARIYVGPYLAFSPGFALILEDEAGIAGYALGALDSRQFYDRYEHEWRPDLCARFADPSGDPASWTPAQRLHSAYHHPDYFCPDPYEAHPSHLHIDLLPRAQGLGWGRRMIEALVDRLRQHGSPGVHLGMSAHNPRAYGFYQRLGFVELVRSGSGDDAAIYMARHFPPLPVDRRS